MLSHRCILVLLVLLTFQPAMSQTLHGYAFTSGVDASKWIRLTNPDTIKTYYQVEDYSPMVEVGFLFRFFGTEIRSFCVHNSGSLICNRVDYFPDSYSSITLSSWAGSLMNEKSPLIGLYGHLSSPQSRTMAVCQTVGTPGNRIMVCEISRNDGSYASGRARYQLQLEEGTNTLRFVYASNTDNTSQVLGEIGFTGTGNRYIRINPMSHVASTRGSVANESNHNTLSWPGNFRYYQFVPNNCANVGEIDIGNVDETTVRLSWRPLSRDSCYLVRYGIDRSRYVEFSTTDTMAYLVGLQRQTRYEVQVRVVCSEGDTSGAASTSFYTLIPSCSNIPFTNLRGEFVECSTGGIYYPSFTKEVVDSGYNDYYRSRHTVHFNTSERDARTSNGLRTIPEGHCSSVRIGNQRAGGQQERITYTLQVDTNAYDLLILRYALVEEHPNHNLSQQPHVIFSITDLADSLIDSCYYADFISGDYSGWISAPNDIVWRNWSAFGVSLTEFHGQKIKVTISNYDCSLGGHFGYAYFTLEGAMKRLESTVCGSNVENTFRAPQGFTYRWYSADAPSVTLSTTDSLHVDSVGNYYCRASYSLLGRNCGFVMSTRAGTRYPMARFTSSMVDGCSAIRHFENQSVVSMDSAHTQLTSEPCERYLWRFSDGRVDSSASITRTFTNGTHTVTLLAMLANGACVDSCSQTFTVSVPSDTVRVARCENNPYLFGGELITESGCYAYVENCIEHILFYTQYDTSSIQLTDTICSGDTLLFGRHVCVDSGFYSQVYTGQQGCDSTINLQLSCMPSYHIVIADTLTAGDYYEVGDTAFRAPGRYRYVMQSLYGCDSLFEISLSCMVQKDTTVCITSLPVIWDGHSFITEDSSVFSYTSQSGTDSIVTYTVHIREQAVPQWTLDQSCDSGRFFIVEVGGGYRYHWFTEAADNGIDVIEADSLYYINPPTPLVYYMQADYKEGFSCPAKDSIYLNPADLLPVSIDFSVTPDYITSETPTVTLLDQSQSILSREWYVNGILQPESDVQMEIDVPLSSDSLEVCLVGYRTFCHQALCKYVPIGLITIYFPNVFTPDGDINNRFTAIGVGIAEFEMWIYDRRGVLLYHTTDIAQGWDGTSGGIRCRQEAYAYTCRYRLKQEKGYQSHTGTVLLLR